MRGCDLRVLLVLYGLLAAGGVWAATPAPAWPQPFTLVPGGTAAFAFFVTKPGPVTALVTWDGPPLTLALQKPGMCAVTPSGAQDGPAVRLSAVATAADVAKGALWRVVIRAPEAEPEVKTGIHGRVVVSAPPVAAGAVPALVQRSLVPGADCQALFLKMLDERNKLAVRARQAGFTARANVLRQKFAQLAKPPAIPTVKPTEPPALIAATPATGTPGTRVTLTGRGLSPSGTRVFFLLNPGVTVEAKVRAATIVDGIATLQVQVPNTPGLAQPFDGQVYATAGGTPGGRTPPLPFHVTPAVVPVIAGLTPAAVEPGAALTLTGLHFAPDAEVGLVLDDGRELALEMQAHGAEKLTATVPYYDADVSVHALCYVRQAAAEGSVMSEAVPVTLLPTAVFVDAVEPAAGEPGQTLLLTGTGFTAPLTVCFRVKRGERDVVAVPARTAWHERGILVTIPDTLAVPAPYSDGTITVVAGHAPCASLPFRYLPRPVERLYRLDGHVVRAQFAQEEPGDLWRLLRGKEQGAGCLTAIHRGGRYAGHQGDDAYVFNLPLPPGWTVARVLFRAADGEDAAAACESWRTPEGYLAVRVRWWNTPCRRELRYTLGVLVTGPPGTSPYPAPRPATRRVP
jgi:hypothetical protein